jgi:hypothetical protein
MRQTKTIHNLQIYNIGNEETILLKLLYSIRWEIKFQIFPIPHRSINYGEKFTINFQGYIKKE